VDRQLIGKRDLEIAYRDLIPMSIKDRHERPGDLSKAVA